MIAEQTLFGLDLGQRKARRTFVLGFCTFMLAFLILGLCWNQALLFGNLTGALLIAGGLGGIRGGGPVRRFSGRETPSDDLTTTTASFPLQTLNLEGQLPAADKTVRLDERETIERDRAHFTAFRLLRWTATPLCIVLGISAMVSPRVTMLCVPAFLWLLLITILSLPQLVILWTEPDALD